MNFDRMLFKKKGRDLSLRVPLAVILPEKAFFFAVPISIAMEKILTEIKPILSFFDAFFGMIREEVLRVKINQGLIFYAIVFDIFKAIVFESLIPLTLESFKGLVVHSRLV